MGYSWIAVSKGDIKMKSSKTVITLLAAALFMFSVWWAFADAPPDTISYQGFLTDSAGVPVNGTPDMKVVFYIASAGGTGVYTETHSAVTVSNGQFNIQLGAGTTTDDWPAAVDFSQALWLEITVAGSLLTPRIPLSTVPYARYAHAVPDNYITTQQISDTLSFADSDLVDLSAINASSTDEGLILPQAADVSASIAEGQISWDSDDDTLFVGTGGSQVMFGTGSGDITAVNTSSSSGLTGGVTTGAANLSISVDGSTIEILGNTVQIKDSGVTAAKIANGAIVDANIDASANIADSKLANITTGGKVANSATTATNNNTFNTIVARDAGGNFSAGTVTASLSGNASTATALAANGGNCNPGNYPLGVDASGAVESCTAVGGANTALNNLTSVAINESLVSDADDTDDLGSATNEWKDLYIDGTANIDALVADTADINAGTVDATIGGTTPAAGTFTGLTTGVDGTDGSLTVYSEQGGTDYSVIFQPNTTMTQNTTYTLPADDGTGGQVLSTDGSGALSWTAGGASQLTDLSDVGTATATSGHMMIADGTNWDNVAISGDVTILSTGVTDIQDGKVDLNDLAVDTCTANQVIKRNAGNTAWECADDATGGGGTVTVYKQATNATTVDVSCSAGVAVGGGCQDTSASGAFYDTFPICGGGICSDGATNQNGWRCIFATAAPANTAYVICTN